MAFEPDIVVTDPDSVQVLLVAEAKTSAPTAESESGLKRYMWKMGCPVGLLVSPESIALYRNRFTGFSDDSIQKVGEFPSPSNWRRFARGRSSANLRTGSRIGLRS